MLKKPASGVLETREAYLVKREALESGIEIRFTNDASRSKGLFRTD